MENPLNKNHFVFVFTSIIDKVYAIVFPGYQLHQLVLSFHACRPLVHPSLLLFSQQVSDVHGDDSIEGGIEPHNI